MYFAYPRADSNLCPRYSSSSYNLSSSTNRTFLGYVTRYKPTEYEDRYWVTFASGMNRHEEEFVLPIDNQRHICVGDQVEVDDLVSLYPQLSPTTFNHCICGMSLSSEPRCRNCRSSQNTWMRTGALSVANRFEIYKGKATVERVTNVGRWTKSREEELLTRNSYEYVLDIRGMPYKGYFHPYTPLWMFGKMVCSSFILEPGTIEREVVATVDHRLMTVELWSIGKWELSRYPVVLPNWFEERYRLHGVF